MPRALKSCRQDLCGAPCEPGHTYCPDHERLHDAARGRRQARGYGSRHDRVRAALLRAWAAAHRRGKVWYCPRCGGPLVWGQPVAADHYRIALRDDPDAVADRLSHAGCNSGARG